MPATLALIAFIGALVLVFVIWPIVKLLFVMMWTMGTGYV